MNMAAFLFLYANLLIALFGTRHFLFTHTYDRTSTVMFYKVIILHEVDNNINAFIISSCRIKYVEQILKSMIDADSSSRKMYHTFAWMKQMH